MSASKQVYGSGADLVLPEPLDKMQNRDVTTVRIEHLIRNRKFLGNRIMNTATRYSFLSIFASLSLLIAGCSGGSTGSAEGDSTSSSNSSNNSSSSTSSASSSSSNSSGSSSSAASSASSSTSSTSSSTSTSSSSSSVASADNCAPTTANTQTGTAAALGAPTTTLFNGVQIIQDKLHRCAKHAVDATAATMPTALTNSAMPYVPRIKVLTRRDAVILYVPNVAGAADYRAYVVGSGVTFATGSNNSGTQPRNAVVACAGYRQRHYDLELSGATPWRELLQAVELPGLPITGNATVVVEAIKTPCPFTGMPAHTDADITVSDQTNTYAGNSKASFRSYNTVRTQYGNEILNGQGAATSWADRMNLSIWRGLPVDPSSTSIPKDPVVIARSAIALSLPATDESVTGPIIDVGTNSMFDDFTDNLTVSSTDVSNNSELTSGGNLQNWFSPLATIPGKWAFWGHNIQQADGDAGKSTGMRGLQLFQRYGRLYQTSGDSVQCCMSSVLFSSLKTLPQQLDATKYVHSFFRVNSDATTRRYWVWLMCGADTREELVDTTTKMPLFHPVMDPGDFDAMGTDPSSFTGKNPSMQHGNEPASTTRYNKECLQFIQHGISEPHWVNNRERSGSRLMMVLHPKGVAQGTISYGPSGADWYEPNFPGWTYRIDSNGNYAGPMMEPFDQYAPLTHFDLFVRPDRLVVFVNGRQALCADISTRPLTMKYGLIMYGNALYHTAAEQSEGETTKSADYHYRLNEPIADTRAWDAVGHSQMIDIPTNIFTTFDASQCIKPKNIAVQ